MDNEAIVNSELQNVKKYWRYAVEVADKHNYFEDFLFIFAIFVNKAHVNYNKRCNYINI